MKPVSRKFLALCVALILSIGMTLPGHAATIITAVETGADVVLATAAGGSLDLTGLSLDGQNNRGPLVLPSSGIVGIGVNALADDYSGAISGPANFGAGGFASTFSSLSGPYLSIADGFLAVPQGYVSGSILAISSSAWLGQSFASLGMTPGTYVWTLASGDTLTLDVVSAVPVPAAVWLFGSAIGLLGWMRRKAV